MKAVFKSKFQNVKRSEVNHNSSMLSSGKVLYENFLDTMDALNEVSDTESISELFIKLGISAFSPLSKRWLYSNYNRGIVVGAGSGEDCIDKLKDDNWKLFDLTDDRMINKAISNYNGKAEFNILGSRVADTLSFAKEKVIQDKKEIEVITIDNLNFDPEIISIDAEGTGTEVLCGAIETIVKSKPDILIGIYHNWIEFLHVIPLLYDLGYDIKAVRTSNYEISQPHLELSLLAKPIRV